MSPSNGLLGNASSGPRQAPANRGPDRCDLDVYSLFGDSADGPIGVTPMRPQQPIAARDNRIPRIPFTSRPEPMQLPVDRQTRRSAVMIDDGRRRARLLSDESDAPFGGGICRQLAAMYTDVGMTTVERVRWLCGWMVLVYALTCCAWFAWPAYTVPVVGILTGTVGLFACQRPHEQSYMTYVLVFLALNYAQLALLVWLVFIALPAEITTTCIKNCAGAEAKAVFIVLLVVATGFFHWRVVTITRHYVHEFRMIQQFANRGAQAYLYDASYSRSAASSTMATDIQSRSSVSVLSVSVAVDSDPHLMQAASSSADPTRL
ncbi:hypothetical protein PHYPSEUDO_000227 [Phytophthora pseudosyringae]|uniref:Transmembrane protein n=1 Tax=Phytophthora pseudosyringae TaxID=221518 RepID=A0A8T1WLE2_9STRA|nr:hypothetical protein PHYPSEUDO_000227 [Phytophthora pseudosyringae]